MAINAYTAVKVFTATKSHGREQLGEYMTKWLAANPGVEIVDTVTKQSSDEAFHCLSIILFYRQAGTAAGAKAA